MSKVDTTTSDKQFAGRPDSTPVPESRASRLLDAVKHTVDGGTLDKVNALDLIDLLGWLGTEKLTIPEYVTPIDTAARQSAVLAIQNQRLAAGLPLLTAAEIEAMFAPPKSVEVKPAEPATPKTDAGTGIPVI
jgi:hypothetical protein